MQALNEAAPAPADELALDEALVELEEEPEVPGAADEPPSVGALAHPAKLSETAASSAGAAMREFFTSAS